MYYRHQLDYKYPDRPDEHMIEVKCLRQKSFDEHYRYFPDTFLYKVARGGYWLLLNAIIFPLLRLTHGLRIYGKENIKNNKELLSGGAITVSNHVFYWDFLCVLKAIRPHLEFFPAWKTNFEGPNRGLIRISGGIPVPTGNAHALHQFDCAMRRVLESNRWLHFFPEGSMWFYYPDIRPLKKAVFKYAVEYNKPILPITISFRPRRGITRLFSKKPFVDLHVGEPILPDKTLSPVEATKKMHAEAYRIMQELGGIFPDSPTYNTDQIPSHYKKTM